MKQGYWLLPVSKNKISTWYIICLRTWIDDLNYICLKLHRLYYQNLPSSVKNSDYLHRMQSINFPKDQLKHDDGNLMAILSFLITHHCLMRNLWRNENCKSHYPILYSDTNMGNYLSYLVTIISTGNLLVIKAVTKWNHDSVYYLTSTPLCFTDLQRLYMQWLFTKLLFHQMRTILYTICKWLVMCVHLGTASPFFQMFQISKFEIPWTQLLEFYILLFFT